MPLKNWSSTHARWSKSSLKHSICFCGIFPSLKQNFIAYRSSEVSSRPDYIFEIHQLRQLGFSRVYSNCCCSCSFEAEIIKIGQSSHKMYSNNLLNFQESTTILNTCTKKSGNLLNAPRWMHRFYKTFSPNVSLVCFILFCFALLLWHINLCRLFNAKSILIHINSPVSSNSVWYKYTD